MQINIKTNHEQILKLKKYKSATQVVGVVIYTNCIVKSLTAKSHVLSKSGEGLMKMDGLFLGRGSNLKNFNDKGSVLSPPIWER